MRSSIAQPAIFISSVVFLRSLEVELGVPLTSLATYFGGHSAGEYSAAHATGSISFADAVRLTVCYYFNHILYKSTHTHILFLIKAASWSSDVKDNAAFKSPAPHGPVGPT